MKLLLVDHFDSFTWNLADLLWTAALAAGVPLDLAIARPHELPELLDVDGLVLSPGPNGPQDAPRTLDLVRNYAGRLPILGVCLGMQVIAHALGGRVVRAPEPVHGKPTRIVHDGQGLFRGLPQPMQAMRYHSLQVDAATLPAHLSVTAWLPDRRLPMALSGPGLQAVQFHPESVGTPDGPQWAGNAVRWLAGWRKEA